MANGAPSPPLPGWLQPLVTVTTQVGVPTVFAGVLLYFVLFRVGDVLNTIAKQEEARTQIIRDSQTQIVATLKEQADVFVEAIQENIKENRRIAEETKRDREELMKKLLKAE